MSNSKVPQREVAMLSRVLEPEVMDSEAEARDYDSMDHSTVNRVFVDDFLSGWPGGSPVLDVGTGTAQIPIELCLRRDDVRVVAIDMAEHMLLVGADNVRSAGLGERLKLEKCDAKRLPFSDAAFAAVMSNSIVHHIPEPVHALREMVRVLQPGGRLFVRDLLRPADDATVRKLVDTYAAGCNEHQRQMFDDSLRAALSLEEIHRLVSDIGLDPACVRQTTDRHWTWLETRP